MTLADVNILIYAFRSDSTDHKKYRTWLQETVNGPAVFGISPQVLAALIRITTHPRIYEQPSKLQEALHFCQILKSAPNATLVTPGERHWGIFETLCEQASAKGNLVQDAWFAALAIESGCTWITTDRDYARFPGLNWKTP